jgi:hypothetical protein
MLMSMDPNKQQPGFTPPPYGQAPQQPQPQSQPFAPGPVAPSPQSPYGFILETQRKPKKNFLKGGSLRSKLLVVVGGGALLIGTIVIVSSIINSSAKANTEALISIAAEQQEIVRVAGVGVKTSTDLATITFAELTKLSVTSQQQKLVKYLNNTVSATLTPATLASGLSTKTNQALNSAAVSDQFDSVFNSTLKASLTAYANDLQKSYKNASGPTIKGILADSYNGTATLLK